MVSWKSVVSLPGRVSANLYSCGGARKCGGYARIMNRAVSATMLAATVIAASVGCGSILPGPFNDDNVSYRPPTAAVTTSPDCLSTNIYTALTGLGPWDSALTTDAPEPGYPPADFQPVAVLRCERGVDENGSLTLDSVRLEGDVAAVDAAFSADSQRFPDHIMASCAYSMEPPAGLWLVDDQGRGFRPAWPGTPCGLQDDPLAALAALTEVSRKSHPTGYNDKYSTTCEGGSGSVFETTTSDDVAAAREREGSPDALIVPALVMPIDDVDALSLCIYSPAEDSESYDPAAFVAGTRINLDRPESAAMVRATADAPFAQPCAQTSTRIATTYLSRPDGSGTTSVSFELDGCRRASGFSYYKAIPDAVLATLNQGN